MNLSPPKYLLIRRVRYLLVVALLILFVASGNVIRTGQSVISELYFILKNPFLSYYEKMGLTWGYELNLFGLIKDRTPPTAVIVAPFRVRPWNILANGEMLPYFLYPRKHVKADVKTIRQDKSITHVMVAWGSWWGSPESFYGWPKFPVNMRKFSHLPTERTVSIQALRVDPEPLGEESLDSPLLLENWLSDSEKEVNYHGLTESSENRQVESIHLTYTSSTYDYWTKEVDTPLLKRTVVRGRVAAGVSRSVNLIAEVRYENGRSSVFSSRPSETVGHWEDLLIDDVYERAQEYAWVRGWKKENMHITRIGVNTGRTEGMPYLEKYGIIEVERGQNGIPVSADPKIDTAPLFVARGNFFRAKNEIGQAIANYELAALLDPRNAWIHCNLGDMYDKILEVSRAIKEYQKAIELEPDVAWFYYVVGEIYRYGPHQELASEYLEKSVELDPTADWTRVALGDLYRKMRRYEDAYQEFKAGSRFTSHSRYSRFSLEMSKKYERDGGF